MRIIGQVIVLGVPYTIKEATEVENPRLVGFLGYTDDTVHEIWIRKMESDMIHEVADIGVGIDQTIRHELVHAFLHESGLSEYSHDETIVEWIAHMWPRMDSVWGELVYSTACTKVTDDTLNADDKGLVN